MEYDRQQGHEALEPHHAHEELISQPASRRSDLFCVQLTAPGGPREGPPVGAPRGPQAPAGRGKERGKKKRERGENGGGGAKNLGDFF